MSYSPVPAESFSGLNLDDPGTVGWGGAIDLWNVESSGGRLRSRGGYTSLATAAAAIDSLFHVVTTASGDFLMVGTTTPTLQVFTTGGVVQTVTRIGGGTGTTQTATAALHNFVSFGTPTAEYVYVANGTDQIRRFEPSTLTFTAPGTLSAYTGRMVAVTPWDNRLVTEGVTQKSRVWFSDAGAPETIGANNYVDLTPGDGEQIVAIKAWRDLLFVFKQSKFFVFYGTSTDSSGNPIFNYRTVNTGVGLSGAHVSYGQRVVTVGPDALYFLNNRGIFRTAGGPPEEVSSAIRPAFIDSTLAKFVTGITLPITPYPGWTDTFLVWSGGRLYFKPYNTSAMLVYDPATGWTIFSLPASVKAACSAVGGNSTIAYLPIGASTDLVYYWGGQTAATAYEASITSYYRSGFSDLGATQRKRVREWILEGSGTPTLKTSVDFGSLETGAAVTLGTSPAVAEGRRRYATRGRQFSWQVSATGAFSLNNLVAHVDERRAPGTHA